MSTSARKRKKCKMKCTFFFKERPPFELCGLAGMKTLAFADLRRLSIWPPRVHDVDDLFCTTPTNQDVERLC